MQFLKILLGLIFALLFPFKSFSIDHKILFEENKNQWANQVKYKAGIGNGTTLFMEKDRFTFVKYDVEEVEKIHKQSHEQISKVFLKNGLVHTHAFQMSFLGANPDLIIEATNKKDFYHNYFIGNDPSKWAAEVGLYETVTYNNIYPQINLQAHQQDQNFKYDFIVNKGGNPNHIQIKFDGSDSVYIEHNRLVIKTSVGNIIENVPYTYQLIDNVEKEVKCEYQLSSDGSTVSFIFPKGYDREYDLIIDPVIVGATYSGSLSTTDTYGHCATYDFAGNIYTGGECFWIGYPATLGAYQTVFKGKTDIAISKLNPTGTNLIWATYIGGDSVEIPNSLFVNPSGEIYILGASESPNYPTTAGCFDNSYNGLADIVITHLNINGTALVGSTYYGGSGDDSQSSLLNTLPWQVNWHDAMRGEIIVDVSGNAYIASFTNSANFPTTTGAYRQTLNGPGTFDAVVFKMNPNLSSSIWSTFVGGIANECAYGLRVNSSGDVYFTGATTSNNFPVTPGAYDVTVNGGQSDAYVAILNSTGTSLLKATFFGTLGAEVGYFLDLDPAGNPCIFGTSSSSIMPVTPGVYSNPGGYNFVSGFNTTLSTLNFSTVFGSGNYLEPSAFMVDLCGNLYMSGFNSTANYPVTSDAITTTQFPPGGLDPVWDKNNSYFIVLSKNATNLLYGSFYYGMHVDGGTSRFDPNGSIYQAICIHNGIASPTPAAYNNGATAPEWDLFAIKISFQFPSLKPVAVPVTTPDTACIGSSVNFANNSTGAVSYSWDFGDGSPPSTNITPSHIYSAVGTYTVTLIANGPIKCAISDTVKVTVVILPLPIVNLGNDTASCLPPNMLLNAGNTGSAYLWSTGATTQTINITNFGVYWVKVDNGACSVSDTIKITYNPILTITANAATICSGQSATLNANGATNYLWNPGTTSGSSITLNPNSTTTYTVTGTTGGCSGTALATITVHPNSTSTINHSLCTGGNYIFNNQILTASGTYKDTLTSHVGCDSIVTLNLIVNPNLSSTINRTICTGSNYIFNNQTLTSSGSYNDTLTSFFGCDSIVTLNLSVNPNTSSAINQTICAGNNYIFNNQSLTATGIYKDTLTSIVGCDSIITLNLVVNPNSSSAINQIICIGGNYFFNNQTLTTAGTYKDTLTSARGCDSIVTLTLVVNPNLSSAINQIICIGGNYFFNNQTLTTAGTYKDTLTSAIGCDSIVTLTLVVNPNLSSTINQTICTGSSYTFNTQIVTTAGTYKDTLTSIAGCDSIVTLNLIVNPNLTSTINQTICAGNSYIFNNQSLTTTGIYKDTTSSFWGCDSIITLNLVINPNSSSTINQTICTGNNYIFNNQSLTTTGIYKDTLTTAAGCDSIVTLNLVVNPNSSSTINQTICSGSSYIFNNQTLTISGSYIDTVISFLGCDSLVTLNLSINPTLSGIINQTICSGSSYTFNNQILSVSGYYSDTLTSFFGCDSIVTLNLSVNPIVTGMLNQTICLGSNYVFNNQTLTASGSYNDTLTSFFGCDSIITLNLSVNPIVNGNLNQNICSGSSYIFNNQTLTIAGTYLDTIASYVGCDSIVTLNLLINPVTNGTINQTICSGSNYIFNNQILTTAGSYNDTLSSHLGCDSIVTLNLSVIQNSSAIFNQTMCSGQTINLTAPVSGATYLWSTNATTSSITISSGGTYWVNITIGACSIKDTFSVNEIPYPQINLGNDTILCSPPNILLSAGNLGCTYLWSTGATPQSITITNFGTYWVKVDNGFCFTYDTIKIIDRSIPTFLGNDTTLCIGQTIILSAPPGITNYYWSTGATTPTINVTTAGNYFILLANQHCTNRDTIKVDYVQPIAWVTPSDFCNTFNYTLDAGAGADCYVWSTGATTNFITITEPGLYWVTIMKKGCYVSDTMNIDQTLGGAVMFLPNTFTPDHNGLNDVFTAKGFNLTYFQMIIFNRWGEEIFQSNNQYLGWDGTYKGQIVTNDVYVCKIKYKTLCSKDELLEKIVHITVLR